MRPNVQQPNEHQSTQQPTNGNQIVINQQRNQQRRSTKPTNQTGIRRERLRPGIVNQRNGTTTGNQNQIKGGHNVRNKWATVITECGIKAT